MAQTLWSLVSVANLAGGASVTMSHGLADTSGSGLSPTWVFPIKATNIRVTGYTSTGVTFINDGVTTQSAGFLACYLHSQQANNGGPDSVVRGGGSVLDPIDSSVSPASLEDLTLYYGVPFIITKAYAVVGAPAGDDVIFDANVPFRFRILDYIVFNTTLQNAATGEFRTAKNGGGALMSDTFDLSAVARREQTAAGHAYVGNSLAAGDTLAFYRNDQRTAGTFVLLCVRVP